MTVIPDLVIQLLQAVGSYFRLVVHLLSLNNYGIKLEDQEFSWYSTLTCLLPPMPFRERQEHTFHLKRTLCMYQRLSRPQEDQSHSACQDSKTLPNLVRAK